MADGERDKQTAQRRGYYFYIFNPSRTQRMIHHDTPVGRIETKNNLKTDMFWLKIQNQQTSLKV